ncbi:hypothetical protein ACGFMK_38005 [Amycolatopsis sp. NPDC049252]|uniref:hypothetical protein n=1 Tax=Amycolatopsis sp. NPDC049252 TaxID=3363933 RepID=UPI00370FB684
MATHPTIEVSHEALTRIRLLQSAWQTSEAAVVDRLLDAFAQAGQPLPSQEQNPDELKVHATYEGQRVRGTFDLQTHHLQITEGPLAGQMFKSPSGAAMAVVRHLNPDVHNNRNGWTFWTISDTKRPLLSMRSDARRGTT